MDERRFATEGSTERPRAERPQTWRGCMLKMLLSFDRGSYQVLIDPFNFHINLILYVSKLYVSTGVPYFWENSQQIRSDSLHNEVFEHFSFFSGVYLYNVF